MCVDRFNVLDSSKNLKRKRLTRGICATAITFQTSGEVVVFAVAALPVRALIVNAHVHNVDKVLHNLDLPSGPGRTDAKQQ